MSFNIFVLSGSYFLFLEFACGSSLAKKNIYMKCVTRMLKNFKCFFDRRKKNVEVYSGLWLFKNIRYNRIE